MSLGAAMLCARLLGPYRYGQLGLIQSTVNLFGLVASLGLGMTAAKHVAEYRSHDPTRAGRVLGLSTLTASVAGLVTAGLLAGSASWISRVTLNAPELSTDLWIAAIAILFSSPLRAIRALNFGLYCFRVVVIASPASTTPPKF